MKLVTQFIDPGEASETNRRLRRAGVMTTLTGYDPHIVRKAEAKTFRIGLWVVFDDQFEDAVRLLEDPGHLPRRVVSRDEMNRLDRDALKAPTKSSAATRRWRGRLIVACVLLVLAAYLFYRFAH